MRMNLSPSEYLHGIFRKSDGLHIGNAKIGLINRHHKNAQVSLLIGDKNSWGQGFAIEAVNAMSEIGFSQLGLQKLEAGCYEENLASLRVFLRCGYSVEGFMRNHVISNGVRKGCFWLGVTADEWRK
jgi:RimJ/RimL family protein N-acetyltransferase